MDSQKLQNRRGGAGEKDERNEQQTKEGEGGREETTEIDPSES